jgi:hypothetical protein
MGLLNAEKGTATWWQRSNMFLFCN